MLSTRSVATRRILHKAPWLTLALAETVFFQTIFFSIILCVVGIANLVLHEQRLGIVESLYFTLVTLGVSLLLTGYFSVNSVPIVITGIALMIVTVAEFHRQEAEGTQSNLVFELRHPWVELFGGITFLAIVSYSWGRFGFLTPWAMSGDARNHIHVIREVISAGGLRLADGYPGLTNGISALLRGWRFNLDSAGGGHLRVESMVYGLTILLFVVLFGAVSSYVALASDKSSRSLVERVAIAGISAIALSPLVMTNLLRWGFLPVILAATVLLMGQGILHRHSNSKLMGVLVLLSLPLLLAVTYPPAMPLSIALLPIGVLTRRLDSDQGLRRRLCDLGIVIIGPLFFGLLSPWLPFKNYLRNYLNYPGGMSPTNKLLLLVIVGALGALSLGSNCLSRRLALSGVALGTAAIATARYLESFLDHPYYVDKLRWLATLVCLVLLAGSLFAIPTGGAKAMVLKVSLLVAAFTCAWLPPAEQNPSRNELFDILTGWNRPSAPESALIYRINHAEPRSMAWRLSSDYVSNQIINMWLVLGVSDETQVITWPYRADVSSIDQVCEFARIHSPMTVWTPSPEMARTVTVLCNDESVSGRSITEIE